ncbi:MAG TPA: hypothetical protein VK791_09045 [bacterium]|nr:hypothetical protein [bacterium]
MAEPNPAEGVTLSSVQWTVVQERFENDIATLIIWLEKYQVQKKILTSEITDLQNKTMQLRDETRGESNVFKEIRLKELLNELKDKLQENSNADHEADTKQKDFEQKCLSLIDLYNGRIESELESGEVNAGPAQLDSKVNQLSDLAKKRNRIQQMLKQYRKKEDNQKLTEMSGVASLQTNDRETLQLTVDLFKDRQKSIREQVEKWSLELDGLRNELKLQGEMKDFLKDIQNMNADANFPQSNLKQEDLDFLSGDSQKKKLFTRLNEVQQKILLGQKLLAQINQLLIKAQGRLDSLGGSTKP